MTVRQALLVAGLGLCHGASRLQEHQLPAAPGMQAQLTPPSHSGYEYVGQHRLPPLPEQEAHTEAHPLDLLHSTLMFTNDGHIYRKQLDLMGLTKKAMAHPDLADFPPFPSEEANALWSRQQLHQQEQQAQQQQRAELQAALASARLQLQPGRQRSLLQSSNSSAALNPTLACQGCPNSDLRVHVNDSTVFPWTAVGMLTRTDSSQLSSEIVQCTGTLIGRRHVLTAGHCVVDTDTQSVISNMQFWLAFNGDDEPFKPITVSRTYVLNQFAQQTQVSTSSLNYDFAVVELSQNVSAGAAQLAIQSGSGTRTYDMQTGGYPGDKPSGTLWTVQCPNVQFNFDGDGVPLCGSACSNMVKHDCLTSPGQSGSAIWDTANTTIRAIVTGAFSIGNTNYNVGTEMNPFVYNTVAQWYNDDATETLPLSPAPPSAPVSHSPSTRSDDVGNWISNHLYVPILPAVIGGIVGVALLWMILACLCKRCRRRPAKAPVGTTATQQVQAYPASHPAGYPPGAYASQYAAYGPQGGQAAPMYGGPAQQRAPASAAPQQSHSPFAASFYQSGDPRFWNQQAGRR